MTKIIVTIPAHNEEKTIFNIVQSIKSKFNYTVLVVDDGSTDKTYESAREAGAVVYKHHKNFGLAKTFNTEIEQALNLGADIIVHINADLQYDVLDIPKLLDEIDKGADLVLGYRKINELGHMPFIKKIGNKCFSRLISWVAEKKIYDAQTGFRVFTKNVAEKIKITSNMTYTQEQILKAIEKNFNVVQIPVAFYKREEGKSRLMKTPWSYAIKGGIGILGILRDWRPLIFFGSISLAFFSVGFIIGLYLLYLYFTTGTVLNKIPLTICSAIFLLIGIQGGFFTLLADKDKF